MGDVAGELHGGEGLEVRHGGRPGGIAALETRRAELTAHSPLSVERREARGRAHRRRRAVPCSEIRDAIAAVGDESRFPRRAPPGANEVGHAAVVVAVVAGGDRWFQRWYTRDVHPLELRPRAGVARIDRERVTECGAGLVGSIGPLPRLREREPRLGVVRMASKPITIALDRYAKLPAPRTRLRREKRGITLLRIGHEDTVADGDRLLVLASPREGARESDAAIVVAGREPYVKPKHRLGATEIVSPREHGCHAEDGSCRRRIVSHYSLVARERVVELSSAPRFVARREKLRDAWLPRLLHLCPRQRWRK